MNVFLMFYDGTHMQFKNCSFSAESELLTIVENHYAYECNIDDVKEFILVNEYTLSYAIEHGYRNIT